MYAAYTAGILVRVVSYSGVIIKNQDHVIKVSMRFALSPRGHKRRWPAAGPMDRLTAPSLSAVSAWHSP